MFENLTDRMSKALRNIRGVGKLTESNMEDALKEVRSALLSADVHFKVVKQFIEEVKSDCIGQEVTKSVTPGQQIIKIIHDHLVTMLGEGTNQLSEKKPLKIMLVGLHGSGKTTTTVKLANHLKKEGYKPALVACDVYRPAAIDQIEILASNSQIPVYSDRNEKKVSKIASKAITWAQETHSADAILFDTAGRLQIDKDLIEEVKSLKALICPDEVLLIADSALGQEAVNVAKEFHEATSLTGIILTKLDGDTRGGAALSMKKMTGAPIKLIGTGEKIENLERFHPERMARRILGMGDVVSLVEKAQSTVSKEETERLAAKVKKADFNLEDFLSQLKNIRKMGSLTSLAGMLPGGSKMNVGQKEEKLMNQTEAIILSMTPKERNNPKLLNGSRRLRIAKGSGTQVKDVNQLLKQFQQMRKMMKSFKGAKNNKKMEQQMQSMLGMPKLPF